MMKKKIHTVRERYLDLDFIPVLYALCTLQVKAMTPKSL